MPARKKLKLASPVRRGASCRTGNWGISSAAGYDGLRRLQAFAVPPAPVFATVLVREDGGVLPGARVSAQRVTGAPELAAVCAGCAISIGPSSGCGVAARGHLNRSEREGKIHQGSVSDSFHRGTS